MPKKNITLRRTLQQVVHCAQEALSVVENSEQSVLALEDIMQAQQLIQEGVIPRLRQNIEIEKD